jgi:glycosyltransferase involved in cell wall biosynthesis
MKVAFYCGENWMPWSSESLYSGIGGAEEAAIHMATQLARRGCDVTVYGQPPASVRGMQDGVRWLPYQEFAFETPGDVFIAWRVAEYVARGAGWRQIHHWLHNRQETEYAADVAALVDRVLVVSRHHATDDGFAALDRRKIHVTGNGLDPRFLRDAGHNEPDRAIYASCPARGLLAVLEMWPKIRRAVPTAKLDVYHGFTPVYDAMTAWYPGLGAMRQAVLDRLDQEGVAVHGFVGHDRLAEGFARAGVWVYPTETPETSCLTAMKALAMGCLPVTSGYAVLGETLGGRDLGPVHPTRRIGDSRLRLWTFRRRVIRAMREGGSAAFARKRQEWSAWARARYSWSSIADDWMALFREVEREKAAAPGVPRRAAAEALSA